MSGSWHVLLEPPLFLWVSRMCAHPSSCLGLQLGKGVCVPLSVVEPEECSLLSEPVLFVLGEYLGQLYLEAVWLSEVQHDWTATIYLELSFIKELGRGRKLRGCREIRSASWKQKGVIGVALILGYHFAWWKHTSVERGRGQSRLH